MNATIEIYRKTFEVYKDCIAHLSNMQIARYNITELVDYMYILHKAAELAEDLRKELNRQRETMARMTCIRWVQETVNSGENPEPIRGKLAIGSPDVRSALSMPKVDTAEHDAIMETLGIPHAAIETGLFRIHWPRLVDYITDLQAQGKNIPKCFSTCNRFDDYRVVLRPKRGVSISDTLFMETINGQEINEHYESEERWWDHGSHVYE